MSATTADALTIADVLERLGDISTARACVRGRRRGKRRRRTLTLRLLISSTKSRASAAEIR